MIEKKRLEELIEQGATVYYICNKKIEKKLLKHKYNKFFVTNDNKELYEYNEKTGIGIWIHKLSKLFETKEEAEWHKEFGCIERTERLELPTWEEVLRDLENAPVGNYVIKSSDGWSLEYVKHNETVIGLYSEYVWSEWESTKENYTLACRKAKELFLGEKK